ncbi:hypothetical protein [Sodalis sp.]
MAPNMLGDIALISQCRVRLLIMSMALHLRTLTSAKYRGFR